MDARTAKNIAIGQTRASKSNIEYELKLKIAEKLNRMIGAMWTEIARSKEENDEVKTTVVKEIEKLVIDIERMIMKMD